MGDLWPNIELRLYGVLQAVGGPIVGHQRWHWQPGGDGHGCGGGGYDCGGQDGDGHDG